MDDIYGDLENYNDANILSELLEENKELKSKLEEYSGTMVQLQKDFDKLNSEYRKLEVNYSSLLKTAKAEIERKTSMITQLNIEKDMLVINAMQKTGKNILRGHPMKQFENTKHNYSSSETNKGNENSPELTESHPDFGDDLRHKRLPSDNCSPIDSVSSKGSVKSISHEYKEGKSDSKKYQPEIRNNVAKDSHMQTLSIGNNSNRTANKIMDRRKSMPVLSEQNLKFSSDEDMSAFVEDKDTNAKMNFKHGVKLSRLEETPKNHEFSRDKNKTEKYNRDKHIPQHKSRKYSPEKDKKRTSRVNDDSLNRSEYRRQRVLESPPSNKYNRSKSRDHRSEIERRGRINRSKSRDRRIEIERGDCGNRSKSIDRRIDIEKRDRENRSKSRDRRNEIERRDRDKRSKSRERRIDIKTRDREHRSKSRDRRNEIERRERNNKSENHDFENCQQKQLPIKNKRCEYEEQSNKRRKTESFFNNGGWRSKHINENVNLHLVNDFHTTCQSPDYNQLDTNSPHHYVREIIHTASVKLDDPRITSKRYVVKKHDGKITFDRLATKDVDIKPVNKSIWGIENVEVPEALKTNPSAVQISDNFVKDIYMDIENPCLNFSLESGELKSLKDEECVRLLHQTSGAKINKPDLVKNPINCDNTVISKASEKVEELSKNIKSLPNKYKIPKVQKTDSNANVSKIKTTLNNDHNIDNHRYNGPHVTLNYDSSMSEQAYKKIVIRKSYDDDFVDKDQNQIVLTAKDIVEDLEMSDEEGDGIEFHNTTVVQLETKKVESKPSSVFLSNEDTKSSREPEESKEKEKPCVKTDYKTTEKKNKAVSKKNLQKKASTEPEKDSKKHKSRKSRQDHININEPLNDKKHSKNNTDYYKCKESQLNKNKFSELFGDSNSLITPDELGIQVSEIMSDKYTSVFDDTQDAIDLSIEEMEKIKKKLELKIDKLLKSDNEEVEHTENGSTVSDNNGTGKDLGEHQIESKTENLNLVVSENNSSVIKTVIISTGIQPECVTANSTLIDQRKIPPEVVSENISNKLALDTIKALATSTPHKVTCDMLTSVVDASDTIDSEIAPKDAHPLPTPSTNSNACAAESEADAPDMRIFVKRRRKIKKP